MQPGAAKQRHNTTGSATTREFALDMLGLSKSLRKEKSSSSRDSEDNLSSEESALHEAGERISEQQTEMGETVKSKRNRKRDKQFPNNPHASPQFPRSHASLLRNFPSLPWSSLVTLVTLVP